MGLRQSDGAVSGSAEVSARVVAGYERVITRDAEWQRQGPATILMIMSDISLPVAESHPPWCAHEDDPAIPEADGVLHKTRPFRFRPPAEGDITPMGLEAILYAVDDRGRGGATLPPMLEVCELDADGVLGQELFQVHTRAGVYHAAAEFERMAEALRGWALLFPLPP